MNFRGLILLGLVLFHFSHEGAAQEVDRERPAVFDSELESQLTPLDEVLKNAESKFLKDEAGAILIDERIDFVAEDGKYYRLYRQVNRANTEAGTEALEKETFSFSTSEEKITLISAHTIQPDGSKDAVRKNAALIQNIGDAGNGIYQDRSEMIVIFPNVKPKSLTESIVLITREGGFRVPDEFMTTASWDRNIWPLVERRWVLDLPNQLAERIGITRLGAGVPAETKVASGTGRTRFSWNATDQARRERLRNKAPARQAGPATLVTTWKSWDDLALWYADLLEGRADLPEELKTKLEEWTKGLTSQDEIIEVLYSKVANDVRYVGLEFGLSGLQPYSCDEVWKNGYGDCKDKSNLLRALLMAKGIEAHLALVDTDHGGGVDMRSPSYGPFNHAILAVKDAKSETGWRLLDPTISRAPAGTIGQWVADRDVLILKEGTAIWTRSPKSTAGEIDYQFTLDIESSGSLSGWMEVRAKGYFASSEAEDYANRGREAALRSAQNMVENFFPRAEVIDLEHDEVEESHENFTLRAYFVSPHPFPQKADDPVQFLFPETRSVMPYLGEKSRRSAPWFWWKDLTRVHLDVGMPDGWKVGRIPGPISIGGDALEAKASWKADETTQRLKGDLEIIQKESTLKGAQFASAFNAVNSLSNWLKRPAQFTPGTGEGVPPVNTGGKKVTVNLPIMPTGDGQMSLVNVRYPVSANPDERRAALRQTMQYFPNDLETQFSARSQLAYLEYYEDHYVESVKLFDSALADLGKKASSELRGWAKYIRGLAMLELDDRREEGVDELVGLSKDRQLDDYRRSWSAYYAAESLEEESPERAVEIVEPLLKADDDDAVPALFSMYASNMIKLGRSDKLLARLQTTLSQAHPLAAPIFTRLARLAKTAMFAADDSGKSSPDQKSLHQLLASLDLVSLTDSDPDLAKALSDLESSADSQELLGGLRQKIIVILTADDVPEYLRKGVAPTGLDSLEAFEARLTELRENKDYAQFLTTLQAYFETFPPSENFSFYVWKLLSYVEFYERPGPGEDAPTVEDDKDDFFPKVAEIASLLPTTDENYYECKFTEGRWLENRERYEEVAKLYEALLEHPDFNDAFSVSAASGAGAAWEKVGQFDKAEASYLRTKHEADEVAAAVDGLLRVVLIRLETGRETEALELLDEIRELDADTVASADFSGLISSYLELSKQPAEALAYWKHTASWWPKWQEISQSLPDVDEKMTQRIVMGLVDDQELYQDNFSKGVADKDSGKFFKSYEISAHSARWNPDMMPEMARMTIYGAASLMPTEASQLRAFVASAYGDITPTDEDDAASFYLLKLVSLGDDHPDKAVQVAALYFADHPQDHDTVEVAMARVWAFSAVAAKDEKAMTAAAAMLESQLQSSAPVAERGVTISSLADLYRAIGDVAAETALLRRELKHPSVRNDESFSRGLSTRLTALADASEEGDRLSGAVRAWIEVNNLEWLDACQPLTLEDRRLRNLEETVADGSNAFDSYQNVKLWLLAAEKSDLSVQARWEAFRSAVFSLVDLASDRDRKFEIHSTALELDLPDRFLNTFVYYGTSFYADLPNREQFGFFRNHPAGENLWEKNDKRLVVFDALAAAPASDSAARLEAVEKIISEDVSSIGLEVIRTIYRQMLEYCFYDAADEVRSSISDWTLDNSVDQTALTLKLEFLKTQKLATEFRARNEALRKLVAETLGFEALEGVGSIVYRYTVNDLPSSISSDDTHRVILQAVKDGRVGFWRGSEWFEVCESLPYSAEMMDFRFEMLNLYLNGTEGDLDRSAAILSLSQLIDTDDAGNRERIEKEICAEWERQRKEAPLTWEAVRYYRIKIALRSGDESVNPEQELADLSHPYLQDSKISVILGFALAKEDKPLIERTVKRLDVDELVSDSMLELTLPALEILGSEAELELVREEATIVRERSAIEAWASGGSGAASQAIGLSEWLKDAESLPEGWFEGTLSLLKNKRHRLGLLAEEAMLREDWGAAVKYSTEAIEGFPTYYHFYNLLGRSAFNMGDFETARQPLQTFIKYAHDSRHHEKAKQMLESIEKK